MSLILSGTDGVADVDGSAATPAIRGTDANTGIFFPAADTIAFSEGGAEVARFDSSGNFNIGNTGGGYRLDVTAGDTTAGFGYAARLRSNATAGAATLQFTNNAVSVENGYIRVTDAGLMSFTNRAYIDSSGNFLFNSGYGSAAVAYGCRAWVNFNGTGTVAIRASGNVSSITDNSTGNYTVNFTTAMPDANFAANVSINNVSGGSAIVQPYVVTPSVSSSVQVITLQNSGGSPADTEATLVTVFR
jgi:hypothetical protein